MKPEELRLGNLVSVRTITEILKDADEAKSMNQLLKLEKELVNNKYKYSLVDLQFAKEHLNGLINNIWNRDCKKIAEFTDLFKNLFK